MKIIITGATSGFGKAIAESLAKEGKHELWLVGRRGDRLQAIQENLEQTYQTVVHTSVVDVQQKNEVNQWAASVNSNWKHVDVLINNAGLALGMATVDKGSTDDWDTMIDTNIKGLLYVTRAIAPLMTSQRKGHIINMGSTAGKVAYANGNVYCATKFAVDALSQSMRIDLLPHNIKVTSINPGMAETEFSLVRFKGDLDKAAKTYDGFKALQAEDIAQAVHFCVHLPEHVCINDLTITCTQQANSIYKLAE
jgi:3-hydroxy acid dehydrogenase/malonic semialdehyde reductase